MAKRLVKGAVYPIVNEDGSISLGAGNKLLAETDKGVGIPSLVDGKVPESQLPPGGGTLVETYIPMINLATPQTI